MYHHNLISAVAYFPHRDKIYYKIEKKLEASSD